MELDKGLQERSEKFEKEKQQLVEQNKQLRQQLDKAEAENATIRSRRQEQENELKDLRENKQLLDTWEKQIHDIITWISEEKDARYICTMYVTYVWTGFRTFHVYGIHLVDNIPFVFEYISTPCFHTHTLLLHKCHVYSYISTKKKKRENVLISKPHLVCLNLNTECVNSAGS